MLDTGYVDLVPRRDLAFGSMNFTIFVIVIAVVLGVVVAVRQLPI